MPRLLPFLNACLFLLSSGETTAKKSEMQVRWVVLDVGIWGYRYKSCLSWYPWGNIHGNKIKMHKMFWRYFSVNKILTWAPKIILWVLKLLGWSPTMLTRELSLSYWTFKITHLGPKIIQLYLYRDLINYPILWLKWIEFQRKNIICICSKNWKQITLLWKQLIVSIISPGFPDILHAFLVT